jgi:hypothetical protein
VTEPVEAVPWHYKVIWLGDPEQHVDGRLTEELDQLGKFGWEVCGLSTERVILKRPLYYQLPATSAVLRIGGTMPGQITVDTTNETVTLEWVDDKGDTNAVAPTSPDGSPVVVTFTSDNDAVATVVADASSPLQGDITPVAEGSANIGATIADDQGNPVLEPDGVTPFSVASVAVTVGPGAAVGAALVLSV